ncbi:hypothetical protein E2C01_019316 [Portunus trituberculatus]|uniref:Uncharacterized protein n=1 Tax=Portunus trituberculatus TaxID=210409 RepID=A0A5B7DWW4_PORTR|nr:hypothetical protein [Portunus trituberculatus]
MTDRWVECDWSHLPLTHPSRPVSSNSPGLPTQAHYHSPLSILRPARHHCHTHRSTGGHEGGRRTTRVQQRRRRRQQQAYTSNLWSEQEGGGKMGKCRIVTILNCTNASRAKPHTAARRPLAIHGSHRANGTTQESLPQAVPHLPRDNVNDTQGVCSEGDLQGGLAVTLHRERHAILE